MPEEDLLILDKIKNTTVEEAFKILMPYLENKYENNKELIDSTAKEIKTILDLQKDEVFKVLEKLTKHHIEWRTKCLLITVQILLQQTDLYSGDLNTQMMFQCWGTG